MNLKRVKQNQYLAVAVDGLDGSGKGSCVNVMADVISKAGYSVVISDYPNYQLPWGKFLDHLLHVDDEQLEIKDKMLVYALNRLETVPTLQRIKRSIIDQKGSVVMIFDRFVTSNILTLSYYILYRQSSLELNKELEKYLPFMWEIDENFVKKLSLQNTKVIVPILDPKETIRRINTDKERKGADFYETSDVQGLARTLYLKASEIDDRIQTFSQFDETEQRYLTVEENAARAIELFWPEVLRDRYKGLRSNVLESGGIQRITVKEDEIDKQLLDSLLDRYGSRKLKDFDPYI